MCEYRRICENSDFIEKLHPVDRFAWSERRLSHGADDHRFAPMDENVLFKKYMNHRGIFRKNVETRLKMVHLSRMAVHRPAAVAASRPVCLA
jgi:hypothetical protein